MKKTNWEIISLGGSLVCPEEIDFKFLRNFRKFILSWVRKGKKFAIIVGGGGIARKYQKIAKEFGTSFENLDWIGIFATWLNASLIKSLFESFAFSEIITNPSKKLNPREKILIAGGWKPGWSTDFDAVILARNLKAKRVINLTNIDYVFDKDPKKFSDAKPIFSSSFDQFLKIIGKKWTPGANFPFDPVAARLAKKLKIEIIILNGKNFKNLSAFFKGKKFVGTIIS